MEANRAAEDLDGGLEEHYGGCAIDVVVAVKKNGLAAGNGRFNALDGNIHAQHEKGIVKVGDVRIKECECLTRLGDPTGDQKLGKDKRNTCSAGEFF
jgi:hypothetical protein